MKLFVTWAGNLTSHGEGTMNVDPMDPGWYYSRLNGPPGEQAGPVSWQHLVSYAQSGFLGPDDLVFGPHSLDWQRAAVVPGLFPAALAPGAYAAPAAGSERPRSTLLYWLLPLIAVIVIGAGLGAYFGITHGKGAATDLEAQAVSPQDGEIFLEPAGAAGPLSFADEEFVTAGPSTTLKIPNPQVTLPSVTTTTAVPKTTPAQTTSTKSQAAGGTATESVAIATYRGDTPALYGGSKSKKVSDKEGELRYLAAHPEKATAFCAALNSDPTFRWSGGTQIRPDQLRDYFAELTPVLLTRDTRVTNWGYRNGRPIPRQSVLQAGQLVLIDRYGIPRKRCECGNPLTPPVPSRKPPVYTGPKWPGFTPSTIIVIQQTTVVINTVTVIDVNTGQTFGRPPGTDGTSDGAPPTGTMSENHGTGPIPGSTGPSGSMAENHGTGPMPGETTTTAAAGGTTQTTAAGPNHGPSSATATGYYGEGNVSGSDGSSGQAVGNVTYPQGVVGQAFGFDGSSYVEMGGTDPAVGNSDFTIALWVYFNTVGDRDPFVSHDDGGGQNGKWIFWYDTLGHDRLQGQGALRFHAVDPGQYMTDAVAAPWTPQPGRWYHVAVARGGGAFTLYINGARVASEAVDISIPQVSTAMMIGRAEAYYHDGMIDEVMMWGRALSDAEIQALYQAPSQAATGQATPGTFSVYKLEAVGLTRSDADAKREMTADWGVEVTINADNSLSGSGPGSWHAEGAIFDGSTQTGTYSVDAEIGVDVGGYAEVTSEGRTLHIEQKLRGYQISNLNINTTGDKAKAQADIEAAAQGWISAAIGNAVLEAGSSAVYAYGQFGGYAGSINLLPVR
jgi:hypothetical protein